MIWIPKKKYSVAKVRVLFEIHYLCGQVIDENNDADRKYRAKSAV
jgi:hypothetical protein